MQHSDRELESRYFAPVEDAVSKATAAAVRAEALKFAKFLRDKVPQCYQLERAFDHLDQVVFLAESGLASHASTGSSTPLADSDPVGRDRKVRRGGSDAGQRDAGGGTGSVEHRPG